MTRGFTRFGQGLLWTSVGALVLSAHVAVAAWAMRHQRPEIATAPDAFMIDLAPPPGPAEAEPAPQTAGEPPAEPQVAPEPDTPEPVAEAQPAPEPQPEPQPEPEPQAAPEQQAPSEPVPDFVPPPVVPLPPPDFASLVPPVPAEPEPEPAPDFVPPPITPLPAPDFAELEPAVVPPPRRKPTPPADFAAQAPEPEPEPEREEPRRERARGEEPREPSRETAREPRREGPRGAQPDGREAERASTQTRQTQAASRQGLPNWIGTVQSRVTTHMKRTRLDGQRGSHRATVTLTVAPDGSVSAQLSSGTGDPRVDAALGRQASRIPRLPAPPGGRSQTLTVPFQVNIR